MFSSDRFFLAMISYGYFGDLIAHSERLRWLGPRRYDVSGFHTFLGNRAYKGVIQVNDRSLDIDFFTDFLF
jgi:ceramide kinase